MEAIRSLAKELLETNKVSAVIGYAEGSIPGKVQPLIAKTADKTDKLIFNEYCVNNLSIYLTPKYKLINDKPVAIISKGCDTASIIGLIQENQIKREDVFIIGIPCNGVKIHGSDKFANKCTTCEVNTPLIYDTLIGDKIDNKNLSSEEKNARLKELENMTHAERWDFWQKEFERCVKCYACRQACPLCYCERCIVDKSQPYWVDTSAHPSGNFNWHFIRAFHLAGRCIGCDECERACHQNIPLSLLNQKMRKEIEELYGYKSGIDSELKPPIATYKFEDNQDFIR